MGWCRNVTTLFRHRLHVMVSIRYLSKLVDLITCSDKVPTLRAAKDQPSPMTPATLQSWTSPQRPFKFASGIIRMVRPPGNFVRLKLGDVHLALSVADCSYKSTVRGAVRDLLALLHAPSISAASPRASSERANDVCNNRDQHRMILCLAIRGK